MSANPQHDKVNPHHTHDISTYLQLQAFVTNNFKRNIWHVVSLQTVQGLIFIQVEERVEIICIIIFTQIIIKQCPGKISHIFLF